MTSEPRRRRSIVFGAALFGLALSVYLLGYRGVVAGDNLIHVQACLRLASHGELGFSPSEYDPATHPLLRIFLRRGSNGEVYSGLPPALELASAPLCFAALHLGGPAAGAVVRSERFGQRGKESLRALRRDPVAFAAGLVNPVSMALLVLCFFLYGLEVGASRGWAATAALVLGFGTYLWWYAETYWTQPLGALLLLAGLLALRRYTTKARPMAIGIAGGALLGLAALARFEAPVAGGLLLGAGCLVGWRRLGWRSVVAPVSGFVAGLGVTLWWNWHRFGSPFDTGSYHGSLRTFFGAGIGPRLLVSVPGNTVSLNQGLFVFAPPLLVALVVAARAWRRLDVFEIAAVGTSFVLLAFYSVFDMWETAQGWGPRYLVLAVALMLLPVLRHGGKAARRWLVGAGILGGLLVASGILVILHDDIITGTLSYYVRPAWRWMLTSEIWLSWRWLIHQGIDRFWWSRSVSGAIAGVLLAATAFGSATWLVRRGRSLQA